MADMPKTTDLPDALTPESTTPGARALAEPPTADGAEAEAAAAAAGPAEDGEAAVRVAAPGLAATGVAARKRGRPAAHERETRRAEILHAATATFLAHGYSATTLDQIAAAGQVTKRTVYTYVGDKAAVFTAVVDQLHHDVVAQAAASDASDLLELSTRIVRTLHSDEGVGLHRLVVAEAVSFPELAATFYATGPRRYVAALADAIVLRSGAAEPRALDAAPGAAGVGTAGMSGAVDATEGGEAQGGESPRADPSRLDEAERLFGLLLGEAHRRRLLGLELAPGMTQARARAEGALRALGLLEGVEG